MLNGMNEGKGNALADEVNEYSEISIMFSENHKKYFLKLYDEKIKSIIVFISTTNYPDLYTRHLMDLIKYISNQFPEEKAELKNYIINLKKNSESKENNFFDKLLESINSLL